MNTGQTKPTPDEINDASIISIMVAIGAEALSAVDATGSSDDDFTKAEIEEMLAVSVCNNLEKE